MLAAKTAEKIAELQRQRRATNDPIERDRIAEVISEMYQDEAGAPAYRDAAGLPDVVFPLTAPAPAVCECERGPIRLKITLTNAAGVLLDSVELCRECATEQSRALSSLGLQAGDL